jgi:hypothetical protein
LEVVAQHTTAQLTREEAQLTVQVIVIVAVLLIAFYNRDNDMGKSVAASGKPCDKNGRESPESKAVIDKAGG